MDSTNSFILATIPLRSRVSECFDGVQNPVRPAEGLDQSVRLQVLVHPQRIQRRCVKACQEHVHHNQQVQFLVLHPKGYVLIVILELVAGRVVGGVEHFVVIVNSRFQEIT